MPAAVSVLNGAPDRYDSVAEVNWVRLDPSVVGERVQRDTAIKAVLRQAPDLAVDLDRMVAAQVEAATFINNATASTSGSYYPIGSVMAKIWNEKIEGMKANAQSTGGTVNNLQLMTDNEAEVGFMDGAYYAAYTGTGKFEGKPMENLRALVPLYPEPVQLMVARKSGIKTLLIDDSQAGSAETKANPTVLFNIEELLSKQVNNQCPLCSAV